MLRREEQAFMNRNDRMNGDYVRRYIAHFRKNTPMPEAELEWKMDSTIISNLRLEDINMIYSRYITDHNNVVIINAPKKEGVVNPTVEEVKAIIAKVKSSEIAPFQDYTVKEPLIANIDALKGSPVVAKKSKTNATYGTTEWTLKNGIKVVVKPTQFKADEVQIHLVSQSGLSNLSDADYNTGSFLSVVMAQQGVSKFSATDLRKQLAGKSASAVVVPDDYDNNSIYASGSPKDLETIMQLIYLRFTAPRFNEDDFNATMSQYISYVENLKNNPDYKASAEQQKTLYGNHPRRQQISTEKLKDVKFERLAPIYKQLYANARDFTVYVVGNVNLDTLKPLVEKYIGSLPASKKTTKRIDDGVRFVKGEVVNEFAVEMQQPKVGLCRFYTGNIDLTLENSVTMMFLREALRSRYTVSIREEKGGTYSVMVGGRLRDGFEDYYQLLVQFDTNEQMANELSEIVVAELRKIAEQGPLSEDVEKTREYLLKEWSNQLQQNGSWLNFIKTYYLHGEAMNRIANYEQLVKDMNGDKIKALAAKILADGNMAHIIMRPAK